VLELIGAISGRVRILGQAARSIGVSARWWCERSSIGWAAAGEGEEPVTSLLEAVSYRLAFETAVKALAKVRGLAKFCCSDRRNGQKINVG